VRTNEVHSHYEPLPQEPMRFGLEANMLELQFTTAEICSSFKPVVSLQKILTKPLNLFYDLFMNFFEASSVVVA